jgi:hypothetical protein
MSIDLEMWEDEGGAVRQCSLRGTPNQVEWAERIKRRVQEEFERVAATLRSAAGKQTAARRADTEAILAILSEKRAEVLSKDQAGYFIHDWQEIGAQVREMIFQDPRYQALKSKRQVYSGSVKPS